MSENENGGANRQRVSAWERVQKRPEKNHHLRDLPSYWFDKQTLTPEFLQFAEQDILPRISFDGYKLKQKKELAVHAIHNLITTGLVGACVRDTRDWNSSKGTKLRVQVWDTIVKAGLAAICLGSEESRKVTRYRATRKLFALRREWELQLLLDLDLVRNTARPHDPQPLALVYLHSGKSNLVTGEPLPEDQKKKPLSLVDEIKKVAQRTNDGKPDPRAVENGLNYGSSAEFVGKNGVG